MACTGDSTADLRDHFYKHLSTRIKDELVHTAHPIGTLNKLITIASDLDVQVCQCCAKRDWEKRCTTVTTGTTSTQPHPSSPPFATPSTNLNAMEVDATHSCDKFMRHMCRKCLGCSSTAHAKKDSSHNCDLCSYCKRVGHQEIVCMDKFMGRLKSQKAAATGEEGSMEIDTSNEISKGSKQTAASATATATLTHLLEQQKALTDQIAAW